MATAELGEWGEIGGLGAEITHGGDMEHWGKGALLDGNEDQSTGYIKIRAETRG